MANLGGAISGAGTGASIGSVFGPWGSAVGGIGGGLMGLFSGGGGGGGVSGIMDNFPSAPHLSLDDYEKYLSQWDDLINEWDKIKTGESMFDAVKFIYEPQKAELEQLYGINAPGYYGDPNSTDLFARSGTIPRTMGMMNKTGTLDSGSAALVTGQLESQMNKDLASLYGAAKEKQQSDYFNSLANLQNLYPSRFEIRNIPNYLDYFNASNDYNNALAKFGMGTGLNSVYDAGMIGQVGSAIGNSSGMFGNLSSGLNNLFGSKDNGGRGWGDSINNWFRLAFGNNASQSASNTTSNTPGLSSLGKSSTGIDFGTIANIYNAIYG